MKKTSVFRKLVQILFLALTVNSLFFGQAAAEKLNIVTTTTDLASIARHIAGEHAVVTSICTGREDPHFIQAKPSYIIMARDADLWIRIGMDLEIGWEGPVLDGARKTSIRVGGPRHLDASEKVLKLEIPSGKVGRHMGDVHPQGNPHYWLDPLNARIAAKSIADRLSKLEPTYAADFQRNLASFRDALDKRMFGEMPVNMFSGSRLWSLLLKDKLDRFLEDEGVGLKGWMGQMKPFRGQKIVAYHRSWIYFAHRFDLVIIGEMEPKPGVPPSPSHLETIIELVKNDHVKAILLEPYFSRKSAELVASKTDAKVVVCPISVGGAPQTADYLKLIDSIISQIIKVL